MNLAITSPTTVQKHDRISLTVRIFYIVKNHSFKKLEIIYEDLIYILDQIEEETKSTDFKDEVFNPLFLKHCH